MKWERDRQCISELRETCERGDRKRRIKRERIPREQCPLNQCDLCTFELRETMNKVLTGLQQLESRR